MEKDWQLVYSAKSVVEAEMRRAILESAGLEPIVMNKQDSSYLFGDVEVYVSNEQFERVNVDHTYTGMTTIYDAVRVSKNTIAVKVLDMITPRYSYEFMTNKLH
ncbi:MAG: DUF2007 domain-containing protein, partial [Salinivirgaceae bacterium]|nr:DUF2007 domain-containing protein [Salinivirgaceae bacterium]